MKVTLESPDAEDTAVHAQSLRRIRNAMRSLSWLVLRAKVKLTAVDGTQPGDPRGAARALIEVVQAKNPPRQLLLGKLVLDTYRAKLDTIRASLDEWEDLTVRADFAPDQKAPE